MAEVIENKDGSVTVVLSDKSIIEKAKVTDNLAESFSEAQLVKISGDVVDDYNIDLSSLSDWNLRRANFLKLFSIQRDPKNFPWDKCSNVGIPTLSIAAVQFQARSFEAIYGEKELVKSKVVDTAKKHAGLRIAKHMNYQISTDMPGWEEDTDALLLQLPLNGSVFKKTYWNDVTKKVESLFIGPDDLVVNYHCRRIEDAERITHILRESVREVKKLGKSGHYINTETIKEPSSDTDISQIKTGDLPQQRDATNDTTAPSSGEDSAAPRYSLEQHRWYDFDGDGVSENYVITVDSSTKKVLRIQKNEEDVEGTKQHFEFFTHYVFIPNPDGLYGYGFGHFLEGLNEAINSLLNQLIDSGTLANTGATSGFFAEKSGLKKGSLKFALGQFQGVKTSSDDIRKSIYQFEFNPPSAVLFNALSLMQDYASNISTVSDSMLGKLPPSDTTATTMIAVLEQGLKVFSTIQRRIHRSLRKELKKIYMLNYLYSESIEEVYKEVQDSLSDEFKTMTTANEDYSLFLDIIPTADPNMVSQAERFIKARQAWEFAKENPLLSENENALYELSREYLIALGLNDVDRILSPPQSDQPVDTPPLEEEAGFIMESPATVLPEQDHAMHLESHQVFAESDTAGESLTPQGKKLLEAHVRETMAALYLAQKEGEQGVGNQPGGDQGVVRGQGDAGLQEGAPESSPLAAVGNVQKELLGGVSEG